jgi:hypothetical protein
MASDRKGKRMEDLPDWARRFYEDYGSPDLDGLGDTFRGPLMDRKSGLRRDDIIEVLLDRRMLPDDMDPWVRGMLVGTNRNSIDILDKTGNFRSIARDVIVEVRLVTHLRRSYIEDKELLKFEKDDMRRRSEIHERAEKTGEGYESSLWG